MVGRWCDVILNLARRCIPNREVTIRPLDKPWFNSELHRLLRKKRRIHSQAKKIKTQESCF